jgi:hypothetical protein
MSFISLIETIAANLNPSNISEFITLTENLVSIGESVVSEIELVAKPVAKPLPGTTPNS